GVALRWKASVGVGGVDTSALVMSRVTARANFGGSLRNRDPSRLDVCNPHSEGDADCTGNGLEMGFIDE
ncbi:MAG: hypothetical protein WCE49_11690, partial [Terrimicrobiaceae bacterium]